MGKKMAIVAFEDIKPVTKVPSFEDIAPIPSFDDIAPAQIAPVATPAIPQKSPTGLAGIAEQRDPFWGVTPTKQSMDVLINPEQIERVTAGPFVPPEQTEVSKGGGIDWDEIRNIYKASKMLIEDGDFKKGEISARLSNMKTRMLSSLAYIMPGVSRKDIIAELDKEAETFGGFGPALVPVGGQAGARALEVAAFQKAFGVTFKGLGQAERIPVVAKAIKALGETKFAQQFPRIYATTMGVLKSGTAGYTVGAGEGALEGIDEGLPPGQILKHANMRGLQVAAVAGGFRLAGAIDTARYVKTFRSSLVKTTQARYNARISELGRNARLTQKGARRTQIDDYHRGLATKEAKGLIAQENLELQQIDSVVSRVEAELIGLKKGKLFQEGQEGIEDPVKAAQRLAREGYIGRRVRSGPTKLKKGFGKPAKDKPLLPTTRAGEIVETVKEVAKHPVKAIKSVTKQPVRGTVKQPVASKPSEAKKVPSKAVEPVTGVKEVQVPAKKVAEAEPKKKGIFTRVPDEWKKETALVDWGKKGIRTQGNRALSAEQSGKKTRKTFVWSDDMAELPTRLPKSTIDAFKAETDEIWQLQRRGKGKENVWLVPKTLEERLRKELGPEAFVRRPKAIPTKKQELNYELAAMKVRDIDPVIRGEVILTRIAEYGIEEKDLTETQKGFIKEYRDEQRSKKTDEAVRPRSREKVLTEEEAERLAIQEEAAGEIGNFLDGIVEKEELRQIDLLGRSELRGGVSGKQQEFLDKENFKTAQEKERVVAKRDVLGQKTFPVTKPKLKKTGLAAIAEEIPKAKEQVTKKPKVVLKKKTEASVGAAAFGFTTQNPAIARAKKQAKKNNSNYYVVQRVGGKFVSQKTEPKKGYYTIVRPSGEATFIKQASVTSEQSFDYGEQIKKQKVFADKLTKMQDDLKTKRATVKSLQNELFAMVKASGMSRAKVKTVVGLLKNIRTDRHAKSNLKVLMKAISKASQYTEEENRRILLSEIKKEIKKTKAKKKGGILKGKFTPTVQRRLDQIKAGLGGDRDAARMGIVNNIAKYEDGTLPYEDMRAKNEQLKMVGIKGMTSGELQIVLDNIKSLKKDGKTIAEAKKAQDDERIEKIRNQTIEIVTGGQGIKKGVGSVPRGELEARKTPVEVVANWQYGWDNYLDKLSKYDKTSKQYESDLSKFGKNVHRSANKETAGVDAQIAKIHKKFSEIFNLKTRSQINKALNNLKQTIDIGTFVNADGDKIRLKLTKEQIIKKYLELQDPTLERTFSGGVNKDGTSWGMRWTDEIISAINNSLSSQEKAWADYHMQFYQEYYSSVNEVYRDTYNVDLPHNLLYSPIGRDIEADIPENVLLAKEAAHYASTVNGSLKTRTASTLPLRFTSADAVLVNHIIRMEHFKHWANTIKDLRRVFGDKTVRVAIRQYHGKDILRQVDDQLNQMARGGIDKAKVNRGVDYLRRNFTRAILGAKPAIALKQIPSVLAYTTEMPLADFVSGVAHFWTNPVNHVRFMRNNSVKLKSRWKAGFERDIRFAMKKGYAKKLSTKGSVSDWWMSLIRGGDQFATMQGVWAKYRSDGGRMTGDAKQSIINTKAMEAAEQTTDRTQPSFDLASLSPLQRGGSWMKLFTMFMNQPNKYFRIIADNARNVRYSRQSKAKGTMNILLAWVILPALFQFIADAFQFKKEHQLRAAVLGPINYLLVIGQIAQSVWGWVFNEPFDYQVSPVFSTGKDLQYAVTKTAQMVKDGKDPYEDVSMDDMIKAVEYWGKAAGKVTGQPTPYAIQAERAIRKLVAPPPVTEEQKKAAEKQKKEVGKRKPGWRRHPAAEFIFSPWSLRSADEIQSRLDGLTLAEIRKFRKDNTYKTSYKRESDGKRYPAGHPHQGKEKLVEAIDKEIKKRGGSTEGQVSRKILGEKKYKSKTKSKYRKK